MCRSLDEGAMHVKAELLIDATRRVVRLTYVQHDRGYRGVQCGADDGARDAGGEAAAAAIAARVDVADGADTERR